MNNRYTTYGAWLLLAAAFGAWFVVALFARAIQSDRNAHAALLTASDKSTAQAANVLRDHSLVVATAPERATLGAFLHVDVLSVANTIEAAGKAAGVAIKVSDARPESASASGNNPKIGAVGFVISADGTFSALMHAAQLLETLPLAASVQRLDLQHADASGSQGAPAWRMNVYLRVLTTADISP